MTTGIAIPPVGYLYFNYSPDTAGLAAKTTYFIQFDEKNSLNFELDYESIINNNSSSNGTYLTDLRPVIFVDNNKFLDLISFEQSPKATP